MSESLVQKMLNFCWLIIWVVKEKLKKEAERWENLLQFTLTENMRERGRVLSLIKWKYFFFFYKLWLTHYITLVLCIAFNNVKFWQYFFFLELIAYTAYLLLLMCFNKYVYCDNFQNTIRNVKCKNFVEFSNVSFKCVRLVVSWKSIDYLKKLIRMTMLTTYLSNLNCLAWDLL